MYFLVFPVPSLADFIIYFRQAARRVPTMTDRDNGKDLGLRRKLSLPTPDILEAILAERGPFVDDAEEAECKVREVGEQINGASSVCWSRCFHFLS